VIARMFVLRISLQVAKRLKPNGRGLKRQTKQKFALKI